MTEYRYCMLYCCLQEVPISTEGGATAPHKPDRGAAAAVAGDDLDSLMRRNAAALDAFTLEAGGGSKAGGGGKGWSLLPQQVQKGKGQPGPAMRPN